MTDLSRTIAPKSDQMNADDLISGPKTITVKAVSGNQDPQQPISINYEGDEGKPYKPCKSMRRVMVAAWGGNGHDYVGRSMTLYCDPAVKFGGIEVGGIRISHMTHIDRDLTLALTASKSVRRPFHVKRLEAPASTKPDPEAIVRAIQKATDAAQKGTVAFKEWYASEEGRASRPLFKDDAGEVAKLKVLCTEADAANTADDVFDNEEDKGL